MKITEYGYRTEVYYFANAYNRRHALFSCDYLMGNIKPNLLDNAYYAVDRVIHYYCGEEQVRYSARTDGGWRAYSKQHYVFDIPPNHKSKIFY